MTGNFRKMFAMFVMAAGMAGVAASAHATPILEQRCASDSLTPGQARARLEWARQCGDRINVKSPTAPVAPAVSYLTGATSSNGGIPLIEYLETDAFDGRNSFSGTAEDVNQTFVQNQWHPVLWAASNDAFGFQKWTGPTSLALPRPQYPTFGNSGDINAATQLFTPAMTCTAGDVCTINNPNDCNLYTDAAATHVANTTVTGFYVNGYCVSSCYLPEQQIAFDGGTEGILDAMNELRTGITTLTPKSTLDNIKTHTDEVASYTHDIRDAKQVIFTITTKSGGQLKVTDKHPILEGDGRIVQARSIKVGNRLIKPDGTRDEVVSVTQADYFGKVYNLKPASTNRVANILIAQGFLVGSSRFQNDDVDFINRIILGHGIPANVIPH
ncbi:MAG TPA: Hint domain-containing protein [Kofleriaceae bacterium]|jgi:hypothetical protein|nr:Hint domain-containing protein [Kofleriaceae bacterium]